MGFITSLFRHPQSVPLRKLLFQIHLWIGIGAGLYIIVICVTGSALIFREEITQAMNPRLYDVARIDSPTATPLDVMRSVQAEFPEDPAVGIYSPTPRRATYLAYVHRGTKYISILADPATGRVLGELPESGILHWLQELHFNLLGGRTGRIVNGAGALLLLIMALSGLVIWWPGIEKWSRSLKVNFRNSWKRIIWDAHSAVGFWTSAVIVGWALTGTYFAFPKQVQSLVERISPVTAYSYPSSNPLLKDSQPTPEIGSLIEWAQKQLPESQIVGISLPSDDRGTILVELTRTRPSDYNNKGYVYFYFDQFSGQLLHKWDQQNRTTGDAIMSWMVPLHFGALGGTGILVLWSIVGLCPPLLFATGALMWWNRSLRESVLRLRRKTAVEPLGARQ